MADKKILTDYQKTIEFLISIKLKYSLGDKAISIYPDQEKVDCTEEFRDWNDIEFMFDERGKFIEFSLL